MRSDIFFILDAHKPTINFIVTATIDLRYI